MLPIYYALPPFSLIDTEGESFGNGDIRGKIWVADFIFTTCAGPCPEMTEKMSELQQEFRDADDVQFVSFSVNPEVDTPEVLANYAKAYGADLDTWHFLTGSADDLHRLAVEGFKIGSMEEPLFHSTRFILVDGTGSIRGYYHSTEAEDLADLRRDINRLLATL